MSILTSVNTEIYIEKIDSNGNEYDCSRVLIKKGLTLKLDSERITVNKTKMSDAPIRVAKSTLVGDKEIELTISTYFHPFFDVVDPKITAPERNLWDSLTGKDSIRNEGSLDVEFINSNKLIILNIYIPWDNGQVFKLSKAVVESADIDLDIKAISAVDWKIKGMELDTNSSLPSCTKDDTSMFLKNKLSTLLVVAGGTSYNYPIVKGKIELKNSLKFTGRKRLGKYRNLSNYYVIDRKISGNITGYVKNGTDNSLDFMDYLMSTKEDDATINLEIDIGKSSDTSGILGEFVRVRMPYCNIKLPKITTNEVLTMELSFITNERVVGSNDDFSLSYLYVVNPLALSAYVNG